MNGERILLPTPSEKAWRTRRKMKPWGERYGGTPWQREDGADVFMHRRGQRVRFFTDEGEQVGPEHSNVAPALVWGYAQGWSERDAPTWLIAGIRKEIATGGRR